MKSDWYKLLLRVVILGLLTYNLITLRAGVSSAAITTNQEAPAVSIINSHGVPLKISSITTNATVAPDLSLTYAVTNVGGKQVDAYGIRVITISDKSTDEDLTFRFGDSPDKVLQPGQTEWGGFEAQAPSTPVKSVKLVVDFVEFADGTTWGVDKYKSSEWVVGYRDGVRAEAGRLIEVKNRAGTDGLIKFLGSDDENTPAPPGKSARWEEGFHSGVASVRQRLKRAGEQGGSAGLEGELRQITVTTGGSN
jgi:hypothetical protein